jgi:dCTP deaminase
VIPDHVIRDMIVGGHLGYTPFHEQYLNPASIDMTLYHVIRVPARNQYRQFRPIDTMEVRTDHTTEFTMDEDGEYTVEPHQFFLACTRESVRLPNDMISRVEGKSSIGRLGLAVHITAGFIDPGFEGQVTLEVANLSPWPITLHAGMRIAQMAFSQMSSPSENPYWSRGHYQGQRGPTESRYRIEPGA